jgi:hypothetical protein
MSDTPTQSDVVVDSSPQVEEVIEDVIETTEESESTEKEAETEKTEESETTEDDEHSLPNGVKKRIDKITRQKYEAVAEANRLKAELEQMKAQIAPKQEAPDISNFDTFEEYSDALAEYKYQQKIQQAQNQQSQQTQAQKNAQEWVSKVEKVRSVAPDFDDAFSNVANIEFAPMALEAVAQHPKGAEIAYMLGKDVSEAYRIAALPPSLQLMAIGEIAAKTSLPKTKAVSTAPKPVKPVNSGGTSNAPPSDMDEWVKWRNQQLRQKR